MNWGFSFAQDKKQQYYQKSGLIDKTFLILSENIGKKCCLPQIENQNIRGQF